MVVDAPLISDKNALETLFQGVYYLDRPSESCRQEPERLAPPQEFTGERMKSNSFSTGMRPTLYASRKAIAVRDDVRLVNVVELIVLG